MNKFYVFSNIDFARKIFQNEFNEYDFIDLKVQGNPNIKKLNEEIFKVLNKPVTIESRKELNSAIYKMLNTENIILYFVFSLIVVISLFSLFGSIVIMYLRQKKSLLFSMQWELFRNKSNKYSFFGLLHFMARICFRVLFGIANYNYSKKLPILYVPSTSLAYPVEIEFENCLIVLLTVFTLGSITSVIATASIKRKHICI